MNATKQFPLCDVLTVTTRRLLTTPAGPNDNGIGALYSLLGWMTNDSPFTHQLGRFVEECKPWLIRWFPELEAAESELPKLDQWLADPGGRQGIETWLWYLQQAGCKPTYDVPRIPRDDHDVIDPYDEIVQMRGTDEGIVLVEPTDAIGPGSES